MKKIISVLIVIVILFGLYKLLSQKPTSTIPQVNYDNSDLILYYGEGCPHCKLVEDFISKNDVNSKMKITQKEVYNNKQNQQDLLNMVSKTCPDQNQGGIGVPIALDVKDNKCLSGDQDIINFITSKLGIPNK